MSLRLTQIEFERLIRRRGVQKTRLFTKRERVEKLNAGRPEEDELARQLHEAGLTGFIREYRFVDQRKFRFDFAFVPQLFAIEIDGAVHRIKGRFKSDREKMQLAMVAGWRVLHVGPDQVRSGEALSLVKRVGFLAGATELPSAAA